MSEIRKSSHIRTSARRPGHKLTKRQTRESQEKFLASFAAKGIVRVACVDAGIDRSTVRNWEEHDETFSFRYNQAKEDVNDAIREEIRSRGMEGEEEYVVSMGKVVYWNGQPLTMHRKSDQLLMFLARARMVEFREKQAIEVSAASDVSGFKELLLQRVARLEGNE